MIKINLARRKKAAGGFDFKNLDAAALISGLTSLVNLGGKTDSGDAKKFDINGPIPKLIIASMLCYFVSDTLETYRADAMKAVTDQLTTIEKEKSKIQASLAKIKGYEPIKKQLEEDEATVRTKLEVLDKLLANRNAPSKIMTQIAQSIPEELWLSELKLDETSVKLAGATPSYSQVSDFIKALNGTSQFIEISLNGIKESTSAAKDQRVQSFELRAKRRGAN